MNTIQFHKQRERIEVSYGTIPSNLIRYGLKERGFRWDGKNKVWHLFSTANAQESISYASKTVNGDPQQVAALLSSFNEQCHIDGIRGMEASLGIS